MSHYLIFFFGMVVGACVGVLAISLCCMAAEERRHNEHNRQAVEEWLKARGERNEPY